MRHFLSITAVVCVLFLGTSLASAVCSYTITNCLTEELSTCAYDGSSFWDTIYSYSGQTLESEETDDVQYGCNASSGCYIIGQEDPDVWLCQSYDVEGTVDGCGGYVCIDDSDGVTFNTGSSEYTCSDNTCTTD